MAGTLDVIETGKPYINREYLLPQPPQGANYREANGNEHRCGTCLYFEDGACAVWNASVSVSHVCNTYEVDQDLNEPEYTLSEGTAWSLYCASKDTPGDKNGSVVKTVLRTGTWRYSPGAGQRPIPRPLRVISGHSADPQKEVGMADILEAFKDGAIEHVTVPLSHEDNVHENTGFIKDLFVEPDPDHPGQSRLRAVFNFTEPEIKDKVKNGSIANTSVGLLFNYVRKDDGKEYPIALAHVALTNHPWINGMEPFGALAASEDVKNVIHLVLTDGEPDGDEGNGVVWNSGSSYRALEQAVCSAFNQFSGMGPDGISPYYVRDITGNTALVTNETSGDSFVVPFSIENGGGAAIPPVEQWVKAKQEWIAASEALGAQKPAEKPAEKSAVSPVEVLRASEPDKKRQSQTTNKQPDGGNSMSDVLEGLELADDVRSQLERALEAQQEVERLREQARKREVEDKVEKLKDIGFSEQVSLLTYVQDVMLSDNGAQFTLNLSEDKSEKKMTATDVIEGFIERMPKEAGKVNFGEQATDLGLSSKRPEKDASKENKTAKERAEEARDWLYSTKEN